MFVGCGWKNAIDNHNAEYRLIDTDFEERVVGTDADLIVEPGWDHRSTPIRVITAVIAEYNKRNLNVAANLVRAYMWLENDWGYDMREIMAVLRTNTQYARYIEELDKYLVLI